MKSTGTVKENQICLKRKGVNNQDFSQTDGKKQIGGKTQSNVFNVISTKDRARIEHKRLKALGILQELSKKRKVSEAKLMRDREQDRLKKSNQG